MKSLRVLVLLDPEFMPPDSIKGLSEQEVYKFKTEYDVIKALRSSGHDVRPLGVRDELKPIRDEVESFKPDVVFNLLEAFHGETAYDHNVAAYLELVRVPYTGCNPRGMILAGGKDLSKKLLTYHRIPMPKFAVFPMGRKAKKPPHLEYPLIVKSASEDGSFGISQASLVHSDDKLAERVTFIHERIGTAAMVEQYIDGRELYVGVLGNDRLRTLPIWELEFSNLSQRANRIATSRVKHDPKFQELRGILQGPADDLSPELAKWISTLAKRIHRNLHLDGYSRIDFRLSTDNIPYFLEANPNPEIAESQEFAQAALHDGLKYKDLLNRILMLGISRAKPVE